MLTYGYDNDSRINSMSYQLGTSTSVGTLTYQYDAAGRRTQMGGSLAATGFPQAVSSAVYDVANELTNWNGTTITPDANGNILNDGVAAYTWNGRNQLISRGTTTFQYDSYGRRTLNAAGNNLLYEGWNAGQELSGTTPIANRLLGAVDEFFSRTDSTGAYSPIVDALGSVLALTNSSGNTTAQYAYDPFGGTTSSGGSSTNVFQYTGRENDGNGLYSYRARYYDPQIGRFISEDAAGFAFGPNLYQYTYDSPTSFVDPFGLWTGSLGGTVNVNLGFINFQYSGGFVVDGSGNVGVYNTYTVLPGGAFPSGDVSNVGWLNSPQYYPLEPNPGSKPASGWGFGLGLSGAVSNAHSISCLAGPFISGSAGGGEGVAATADGFGGRDSKGRVVAGGGATVGTGWGSGTRTSVNVTNTVVTPLAGRNCGCQ